MKRKRYGASTLVAILVMAVSAMGQLTQTTTNTFALELPRDRFFPMISKAMHDICETDLPALVSWVNGLTNAVVEGDITATNTANTMDAARYITATNTADTMDAARYVTATNTADTMDAARYIAATNTARTFDDAIAAKVFDTVTAVAGTATEKTNTLTVTCLDINGETLAEERSFWCWFTTWAQSTVPATNNIESVTFNAHGEIPIIFDDGGQEKYIVTTHTDGTADFVIKAYDVGTTNYFYCLTPNGKLVKTAIAW